MKRKIVLVGAAVLALGLGGAGLAMAADSGPSSEPAQQAVLVPVPGAKPDLSNVKEGIAIPLGPVPQGVLTGNGVTGAAPTGK